MRFILRLHRSLDSWKHHTQEKLLNMPTLHVDETSLRLDKKNHWVHVYSSGGLTLKRLHRKRGRLAKSDAHNLWERFKKYETAILLFAKEPQYRSLTIELNAIYAWLK